MLHALQAGALVEQICTNLRAASECVKHSDYTVVLRGDSTLRGHFPEVCRTAASIISSISIVICLSGIVESVFNCFNMRKSDFSRKPMLLFRC